MEHEEQVAVINWRDYYVGMRPELALLYAIPNGGKRSIYVARKMKAEGVMPGVPDLHLPVARRGYAGLWIEMKFGKNKQTEEQRRWFVQLSEQGHLCSVCYSSDEAIKLLSWYVGLNEDRV